MLSEFYLPTYHLPFMYCSSISSFNYGIVFLMSIIVKFAPAYFIFPRFTLLDMHNDNPYSPLPSHLNLPSHHFPPTTSHLTYPTYLISP